MSAGLRFLLSTCLILLVLTPCFAGGGPENVLLVVNKSDLGSKTIANHYSKLRFIPARNVVEIDYRGSEERTHVHFLRDSILSPVLKAIKDRKLSKQIDYIVYSTGFPYAVSFTGDFKDVLNLDRSTGTMGSLTGLTYLSEFVLEHNKGSLEARVVDSYINLKRPPNYYATYSVEPSATKAFRHQYAWSRTGRRSPTQGRKYYLAAMLGYTAGRGNSTEEVIHYLRKSALADGSRPSGTIYFVRNDNIRSKARHDFFEAVSGQLKKEGIRAEVIGGTIPKGRKDIAGAVIGYSHFNWAASGNQILPGAIVEHFTSFGGVLKDGASQTPLTEFLKYGAAGSSGTIMEPLANLTKFPHPNIHLHYARGCSLAEAFYQSVANPYQLLVVGDPLCKPWARIPVVDVGGVLVGDKVTGTITLRPKIRSLTRVDKFRLFFDGRMIQDCDPNGTLSLDTTKVSDGYHELRVVAVEKSALEFQGRKIIPITVQNQNRQIAARASKRQIRSDERFRISINAPGAKEVLVYHRRKAIGKMARNRGDMLIDASQLGAGPVTLTVAARNGSGSKNTWFAKPIEIYIAAAPEKPEQPRNTNQPPLNRRLGG